MPPKYLLSWEEAAKFESGCLCIPKYFFSQLQVSWVNLYIVFYFSVLTMVVKTNPPISVLGKLCCFKNSGKINLHLDYDDFKCFKIIMSQNRQFQ